MKNAFLFILIASLGITAEAAPIFCRGTGAQKNVSVTVNNNLNRAQVYKNEKPVMFGNLVCQTMASIPENEVRPFLLCHSTGVADAGYSVILSRTSRMGVGGSKIVGTIDAITFAGARRLATLQCVAAMN